MKNESMSRIQHAGELLRQHATAQLGAEFDFFRRHKSEWLPAHRGQFVVIGKATFGGFYPTYNAALNAGTRMFGLITPFLVEEVHD
jgi:hypothetical protein